MSYKKQNFKDGEILEAQHLNYMEHYLAQVVDILETSGAGQKYELGVGLKMKDEKLCVDAAQNFEGDNTRPVEAAFMQEQIGNIETLLKTI